MALHFNPKQVVRDKSLLQVPKLNVNARDRMGCTALNLLIQNEKLSNARLLLFWAQNLNLNINLQDNNRNAPLHSCIELAAKLQKLKDEEATQRIIASMAVGVTDDDDVSSGGNSSFSTFNVRSSTNEEASIRPRKESPVERSLRKKKQKEGDRKESLVATLLQELLDAKTRASAHSPPKPACDVNLRNGKHQTPLVLALTCQHQPTVELLMKRAGDRLGVNVKDDQGRTPLMHAILNKMTYVCNVCCACLPAASRLSHKVVCLPRFLNTVVPVCTFVWH